MQTMSTQADDRAIPASIARSLGDPAAYASDEIHEAYAWLREHQPLGVASPQGFDPFWVVTKHADILHVSKNNALFANGERSTVLSEASHVARVQEITGRPNLVQSLVSMDGLEHKQYRGLTQAWFMPASIRRRGEAIEILAKTTVEGMAAMNGSCDFLRDVALAYPLQVVMNILGVPAEDYPRMLKLTQELFGPQDPDVRAATASLSAQQYSQVVEAAVGEFTTYFSAISEDRRANPRDDLATLIATAQIDGKPIGDAESIGYYIIVATAGHDTTSSSTGAAMWALATVPGLLERIRADMTLVPQLVEEAIRWATPVKTFMRSASEDTELRDRKISKGDWLMLCYASGNRDEEIFNAPFAFDIDRKPNAQIAFGFGAHSCIGQHLARMEMTTLFNEMLPRLKAVKLAGEPKFIESSFVNGLKSLPIEYNMV
jgi:cytochrome P450